MTHEEAAVHLVREYAQSYTKYPFMIYQIQTKFRDEARPRAGLIRVREFTMKDAYSFHTSQEDLEQYYEKCHAAYERIFERVGVPEVVSVKSDSGMMGGNISHEFMLLTPVGEDSIDVHLTIADQKVEKVEIVGHPFTTISKNHQNDFAEAINGVVDGKPLKDLKVDKVAGASWTSDAFNKALEVARQEASIQ